MANYSLVAGPRYNPLDFDTTLKVLQLSQARHDELEEAYGELGAMSDTIGGRLDEKADPIAYARWKQYNDALNSAADNLSMYGLNPQSRRTLMDTKRYYGKQVAPIDLALQNRTKIQDEARKQLLNNPTWYTENDVLNASVDRWLENEGYDWGKQYSGAMLTQQVSTQLAPLAKVLRNYGKGIPVDKYTDTFLKQHGVDVATAYRMMMEYQADPENVSPDNIIAQIVNNVVDTAVGPDWNESTREAARRNAFNYAQMGITSAIGQDEVQPIENFAAREDLRHTNAMLEKGKGDTGDTNGINIAPAWLIANNKDMDKKIKRWGKYFKLDERTNTYVLTDKGKKLMAAPGLTVTNDVNNRSAVGPGTAEADEFRKFLKEDLGWEKRTRVEGGGTRMLVQPGKIGNLYTNYYNRAQGKAHDTYLSTEYQIRYPKAEGEELARQLSVAMPNSGLEVVEFEADKGEKPSFKLKKYLTSNDIAKNDYSVVYIAPSRYGTTAVMEDKDGNQVRVKVPESANIAAAANVRANITAADDFIAVLRDGHRPQVDPYGNFVKDLNGNIQYDNSPMTQKERIYYEAQLQQALGNVVDSAHSTFQLNTMKRNSQAATPQYVDAVALANILGVAS